MKFGVAHVKVEGFPLDFRTQVPLSAFSELGGHWQLLSSASCITTISLPFNLTMVAFFPSLFLITPAFYFKL
jgi:hypothetical protein